jgi:hypothetical protein
MQSFLKLASAREQPLRVVYSVSMVLLAVASLVLLMRFA